MCIAVATYITGIYFAKLWNMCIASTKFGLSMETDGEFKV